MDKSNQPRACSKLRKQEEAIAETASKLADKTRKQRKEDLDSGRRGSKNALREL